MQWLIGSTLCSGEGASRGQKPEGDLWRAPSISYPHCQCSRMPPDQRCFGCPGPTIWNYDNFDIHWARQRPIFASADLRCCSCCCCCCCGAPLGSFTFSSSLSSSFPLGWLWHFPPSTFLPSLNFLILAGQTFRLPPLPIN